ncbi:9237_t:CDS:10 [Cetraspora pellucida]|uniref:9237_t:CDS:1 n=1 Tax=Cetraspora pellucida TaxID=1433469 RepID=A0ACA9K1R9_9GLOM|nr:9237_t:CDS:10 [Cetraspora pellucida]
MDAIETYFNNHFPQHDRSSSVIREIKEEIEKIEKIAKAGEKLSKANSSRNKHQENLNTLTGYFNLYIRKGGVSRIDTIDGYKESNKKLDKHLDELINGMEEAIGKDEENSDNLDTDDSSDKLEKNKKGDNTSNGNKFNGKMGLYVGGAIVGVLEGTCKSNSDKENQGKKRDEIIILDLSKGKVGKRIFNDGKTLTGSLKLERFTNLRKLIISSQKITELDVSECPNLKEVDISGCSELTKEKIKSNLIFNLKKTKLSTLANVLTDTKKDGKIVKYNIIDNIGFGDTRKESIKEEDVLLRIGGAIYSAKEGINQILFVVRGKFTKEHTESFNLFENFISDTGITDFTTIVKTEFLDFRDEDSRKDDKVALIRENKDIRIIIEACNGIIHVDNPPMPKKGSDLEIKINREKRQISREMYKEVEKSSDNTEAGKKKLAEAKNSLFKELRVKLALNVPGLPVGLEAQIEVIKSGRGKSTLANVLINPVDESGQFKKFKQVFKEGKLSVSQTRNIQSEGFSHEFMEQAEVKKVSYQVIDTPGIGDTKLETNEILDIISEAVYLVRDGVSRVLFVTDGRFDEYETAAYNLLREVIFDKNITNHTTIVRTKFRDFEDEREQDIKRMKSSKELKAIIESCQGQVIHVDNPPIEIKGASEEEIEFNKRKRNESKKILLDHLKEICQEDPYNPPNLKNLIAKVREKMEKKKKLDEALVKLRKQLKRVEGKIEDEKLSQVIEDLNEEIEKESEAIRQAILEHIRATIVLEKNSGRKSIRASMQSSTGINLEMVYESSKYLKGKEKDSNKESISNRPENESEKNTNLSNKISEIITNLTKEEKQIREVIDDYRGDIRNILIVGHANSGKSTLAKVLLNKEENPEKVFRGSYYDAESQEVQIDDTFGINDNTGLPDEEVIQKIAEVTREMQIGINQVFFVFKDDFSKEQARTFNIFKDFVFEFENGVTKFATLVRTNFEQFQELQACEKDRENLLAQNQELKEIITFWSRKIILNHLTEKCSEIYKLKEKGELKIKIETGLVNVAMERNKDKKIFKMGLAGLPAATIEHSSNEKVIRIGDKKLFTLKKGKKVLQGEELTQILSEANNN